MCWVAGQRVPVAAQRVRSLVERKEVPLASLQALLDIEPRLRRTQGHQRLPRPRQAIQRELSRPGFEAVEAGVAEEKGVA